MGAAARLPLLALLALLALASPAGAAGVLPSQAKGAVGRIDTVCGVVVKGETRPGGEVLLLLADPGKKAPAGFAILIRAEDRAGFAGSPEKGYLGKRVCVTGMIRSAKGLTAHIAAKGPWQVEDVQKTEDSLKGR